MANEREFQYGVGVDDQGSLVFDKFKRTVVEGSQEIQESLKGVTAGTKDYSDETNRLTQFIRTQRTEQREHTFLFRQTKDVVGAAALGLGIFGNTLGQTSEGLKNVTNSLNDGFVAFQGLDFLLASAGAGPWGMALAAAGGLTAALFSLDANSGKAADSIAKLTRETLQLQIALGEKPKVMLWSELDDDIIKATRHLEEATEAQTNWWAQVVLADRSGILSVISKWIGTDTEYAEALNRLEKAKTAAKKFTDDQIEENKKGEDAFLQYLDSFELQAEYHFKRIGDIQAAGLRIETIKTMTQDLAALQTQLSNTPAINTTEIEKLRRKIDDLTQKLDQAKNGIKALGMVHVDTKFMDELTAKINEDVQTMNQNTSSVMEAIGSSIKDGFQAAFSGSEDAGRTFLKTLLNRVIDTVEGMIMAAEAASVAKGVLSFGLTLISDLPKIAAAFAFLEGARAILGGFHQGGTVPKAHGGMYVNGLSSEEYPIVVRGGETVRTEIQERNIQNQLNRTEIHNNNSRPLQLVFNNYAPITSREAIKETIQELMRALGTKDVADVFVNNRSSVVIA